MRRLIKSLVFFGEFYSEGCRCLLIQVLSDSYLMFEKRMSNVIWQESQLTPETAFQTKLSEKQNSWNRFLLKPLKTYIIHGNLVWNCHQLQIVNTMVDAVSIEESELPPNLDDDSLDAEVSALFHNYLQMSEVSGLFITQVNP